jgi:4-diphosphocytidyl-2-C-methyl-D-erythritol kinase
MKLPPLNSTLMLDDVAPAKVNLSLRVVGRRPDGFHLLDMVNTPLGLSDRIRLVVQPASQPSVSLAIGKGSIALDPSSEQPSTNLASRAAEAFLGLAGCSVHVAVTLEKHVPFGAGLGGGSSDAACVLRLMHRAFPEALTENQMRELALQIGSDVPFFLNPGLVRVRGVGERCDRLYLRNRPTSHSRIVPVPPEEPLGGASSVGHAPHAPVLLIVPPWPLATPRVYEAFRQLAPFESPRGDSAKEADALVRDLTESMDPIDLLRGRGVNDLEVAAEHLLPELKPLRQRLSSLLGQPVRLSGSGSALFCLLPATLTPEELERVNDTLKVPGLSLIQTHLIF